MESVATKLIAEAVEASGSVAVEGHDRDEGFDLGIWSDDLDAIAANPMLIQLKQKDCLPLPSTKHSGG